MLPCFITSNCRAAIRVNALHRGNRLSGHAVGKLELVMGFLQPFILKRRISFDIDFVLLGGETHQAEKAVASIGATLIVRQDLVNLVTMVSLAGKEPGFRIGGVELPVVA